MLDMTGTPMDIDFTHKFGVAFDFATTSIVVVDQKGIIINFNPYAEKKFGYKKEEVLEKPVGELLPGKFIETYLAEKVHFPLEEVPAIVKNESLSAVKKDGTSFPVEISLSSYFFEKQPFTMIFISDIALRKQQRETVVRQKEELERATLRIKQLNAELEQKIEGRTKILLQTLDELEKSKDELKEALKAEKEVGELKSRFVSMASHEFRTPLSTILSSAFLLEKYNNTDNAEARLKHIKKIRNSVSGLKSILDDFLIMGRIEEGKIYDAKEKISGEEVVTVIGSVISDMESRLKTGQSIDFQYDTNFNLFADSEILRNIMINLLANAIKFSKEGGKIRINCQSLPDEVKISVKDEGIGISEADQKKLFTRFFRASNAGNIQGTGLGLYIVARYLEMINGEIKIESGLNAGSTFTLFIPKI